MSDKTKIDTKDIKLTRLVEQRKERSALEARLQKLTKGIPMHIGIKIDF